MSGHSMNQNANLISKNVTIDDLLDKDAPVYPRNPVLVVDDEVMASQIFQLKLEKLGFTNIKICNDSRNVLSLLKETEFELIFLDIRMPHISGEELIPQIINEFQGLPIIVMTSMDDIDTAVRCVKNGVFDYLSKTVSDSRLFTSISRAIEYRDMNRELTSLKTHVLKKELLYPDIFSNIVSQNDSMFSIFQYVESIAPTMYPVFITGETGVGKGLLAEAIHKISQRKGPFIHVNVSGIDANMFADTLFGHVKGSYTGANTDRPGLCKKASEGTLFLDEIGDLDALSQLKLLTLLQERQYYPIGRDHPCHCNARVITATNCDVDKLVETKHFRKDLYFRLHTHRIHVPPLRERLDDIPILVDYFLKKGARELSKKKPSIYKEMIQLLSAYSFPGNIRELKSMIDDALCRHKSHSLSLDTFKSHINRHNQDTLDSSDFKKTIQNIFKIMTNLPTIKQASEQLVTEALKRANGNLSIAAPMLGISRQALGKRLKRFSEDKSS